MKPAKHKFTILKQVMETIPPYLVSKLARVHGVDRKCRSISAWSHVASMVFAQLSHALSLNDVCDTLRHHVGALSTIRNATAPSRNGLSHANRVRNASMARDLFHQTLGHLSSQFPQFGRFDSSFKLPRRIKRTINIIDSTTIQLFANCMDWAKHRRRKAAAKCHMLLDARTFLPRFAVVKTANSHDSVVGRRLCNQLREGEIVVFDKAYVDFKHLYELMQNGILWVTRAKTNMSYRVIKRRRHNDKSIILDAQIKLKGPKSRKEYPGTLRLIRADVLRDGRLVRMDFITDNFDFSPTTICDLYKARWDIELFFKQVKQTLKLSDFLGYSENAVQWQIWMALLTYVILRFIAYTHKWKGSFARLFTAIRGSMWSYFNLTSFLDQLCCGTAHDRPRLCGHPQQMYLALF